MFAAPFEVLPIHHNHLEFIRLRINGVQGSLEALGGKRDPVPRAGQRVGARCFDVGTNARRLQTFGQGREVVHGRFATGDDTDGGFRGHRLVHQGAGGHVRMGIYVPALLDIAPSAPYVASAQADEPSSGAGVCALPLHGQEALHDRVLLVTPICHANQIQSPTRCALVRSHQCAGAHRPGSGCGLHCPRPVNPIRSALPIRRLRCGR